MSARAPSSPIRPHGFAGERHFVIPPDVLREAARHPVLRSLHVTAAGHFPHAAGHLVTRPRGVADHILILCVEGSGWCRFGGRHWRLRAGDAVLVPPAIAHAYGTTKRRPWSIYWMHFAGAQATAFAKAIGLSPQQPLLATDRIGELSYQFEVLLDLLHFGNAPPHLLASGTSAAHLLALLHLHRAAGRPDAHPAQEKVRGTVDFMRRNVARRVSVADFARVAGLSVPHYSWLFRHLFSLPPLAFFLRLKVQEACRLLATSDVPVKEIASETGFADPLYFSRVFKRLAGSAPRHYRAQHFASGNGGKS
jgi:AraC-like DNA-binding protein